MALTTTQVNAAYVALLGRAAEGSAANWAAGSLTEEALAQTILSIDDSFKNDVERKDTNADFVKALYTDLLGKTGDSEGQTFWTNALNSGLSREEVKLQFINAAKANNENLSAFYAENELFVNNVYGNLLGRGADSDGLKFWADALNNGASKASVIANIITAIQAQPASEDFKTFSAKMAVANTVSASFSGFKSGLNADQKQAALDTMKQIIQSTTADVKPTDETIKTSIDSLVGNYERESLYNFRVSEESYDLGNAESTNSQTFRGTINLIDDKKSTYTDKASVKTGKYSDSLIIDVVSNQANKTLDATKIKAVAGIDSLTINNGTADVTNLSSTGFSQNIKVTGAANVSGSVSTTLNYLEVSTGAGKTATIAVNANLKEYKATGTGNDNITVSGATSIKVDTINTGAGDDSLLVSGNGTVKVVDLGSGNDELIVNHASASIANATINLGAGNDTFTFNSGNVSGATIDGGNGTDTLALSGDASAIKSLTSFEKISLSNDSQLSLAAFKGNIDSLKGATLAFGASASGKALTLDASGATTIDLSQVTKDTEATSGASITLDKVGSGATTDVTVKLNKDDAIVETISLKNLDDGKKVTINGFVTGSDKLKLASGASVGDSIASSDVLKDKVLVGSAINSVANIIGENGKVHSDLVSAFSAATAAFSASGEKGYIAQVKDGKTYLYEITNSDQGTTTGVDTNDTVKLIATFDVSNLVATDFVNA